MVERIVLLRTIDSLWVEHLTEIDDMRRGIGLRGYSGTDPLNEFKREAFALYDELRGFIRGQVASTIFRVQVQRPAAPTPMPLSGPGQPAKAETAQAAPARRRSSGGPISSSGAAGAAAPAAIASAAASTHRHGHGCRCLTLLPGLGGGTRMMREQLGDDVRQPSAAATVGRPKARPQRSVLLRQRPQVQSATVAMPPLAATSR